MREIQLEVPTFNSNLVLRQQLYFGLSTVAWLLGKRDQEKEKHGSEEVVSGAVEEHTCAAEL